ncbi:MAG: alkane 1-monooxygenase [Bacteroidetes bacterium]|nr:alkane 1-monooxygenase [Bacteroidota bacterium]
MEQNSLFAAEMNFRYSIRYLFALLPGILVLLGNIVSVKFAIANIIWAMVILPCADWIKKPSENDPPEFTDSFFPDLILVISSLLHILSVFALLKMAVHPQNIFSLITCALSTGLNTGVAGFICAHELVHRKYFYARMLGQVNLFLGSYMHFYIEHIHGHHKNVGTNADPATARYGESYYDFLTRSVPFQWWHSLQLEVKRLEKEGNEFTYGLSNYVVTTTALELLMFVAVGVILGKFALLAYAIQTLFAIHFLEYVSYIEHYALVRGEEKKIDAIHSWRTDKPGSRNSLFELVRHSDHHLRASKPYHTLVSHAGTPELPSGYFGMYYIALFPKWWFRKVNPLVPEIFKKKIAE